MKTEIDTRQQNLNDAREMLDFIENHPDLPFDGVDVFNWLYTEKDRRPFLAIARALGTFDKKIDVENNKIEIRRNFGRSSYRAEIPQSLVCRKVKVVKEVEECDPLLSLEDLEAAAPNEPILEVEG